MSRVNPVDGGTNLLADPTDERASCGVGVVMNIDGTQNENVIADGLDLLANLEHRGTTGAEENTGDGAGIMLQTPHEFFADELDIALPETYAAGCLFLPRDPDAAEELKNLCESVLAEHGLNVLDWRTVPTRASEANLGETALDSEPDVAQCFVTPDEVNEKSVDWKLYVGRRAVEKAVDACDIDGSDRFYVCSLDRHIVVYKGLLKSSQLASYYPDLVDTRLKSGFALVHARFSTNTLGAWHLAHPYRNLVHNGEFNTIRGNINWMRAREMDFEDPEYGDELDIVKPIIADESQSDSASVDNALELLIETGRDLPHALRMLIPEAWRSEANLMSEERRSWYDFHTSLLEPWDGPALVIATDGKRIAGVLDRNGLRPCRYEVTDDDRLIMSSEAGALPTDAASVVERGRLRPGQLFLADPTEGRIIPEDEVWNQLTDDRYAAWVECEQIQLCDLVSEREFLPNEQVDELRALQTTFGYTQDELENLIEPMATEGKDPIGSMGDDTPLSVLSEWDRSLDSYFKQRFAQVTNPPIDNIREKLVMSVETRLGFQRNLLSESPGHARQLVLDSPILRDAELTTIRELDENGMTADTVDITHTSDVGLKDAIEEIRADVVSAIENGHEVVILSDRNAGQERIPVPSLLATSAVHHHLVRNGLRNRAGLVIESGDPRTVHQIATLVGYGAGAVNPYLAYQTIEELVANQNGFTNQHSTDRQHGDKADQSVTEDAIEAYVDALKNGLRKTMSKMGISTVASYRGAQIFESVGLDSDFVAEYFTGTETRTEGIGLGEIEADAVERHAMGFNESEVDELNLQRIGEFEHRSNGIPHQWNPRTVGTLQQAVRTDDYEGYREFASMVNDQREALHTLSGLLEFDDERDSIPIDTVEPVNAIVRRFSTAAMSLGSLSPEAHENNAIAMNRLGAKSNTGEGGEPPARFGTERECTVKQVASGRFGVTSTYLSSADELQIKMAQGSKPGEGGHLPGDKVNEMIADVRQSIPGIGLISPPPQHDIYSIEDLKQLIHDLKAANPEADVNVKLVSEAGIGTIAAGVAKANADVVHISGHAGGTGASPRTSIKNAGIPWELGLSETNQLLRATGLRSRIRVSVDGGLKTGRDVAIAALLGAEEYVFGTASLVTSGCVMARQCHENTCPVGVATQNEELRNRFPGEPDHVINYMTYIAKELREIMAELGFATVEEMVGHVEVLDQRDDITHPKARTLDLSSVLAEPVSESDRTKTREQIHDIDTQLDWELIADATQALENGNPVELSASIANVDRAVGATLSNRISTDYGEAGLPDDTITTNFTGAAGQSFGAFLASGVTFNLTGVANDYVGKGLSGGKIALRSSDDAAFDSAMNTLIGNVALYGATDGEMYVNGVAGERFAVRNSGANAVVEGVGDHGCEYMTGGIVVVLGETGKNFAAGMSGGVAYVYNADGEFVPQCNTNMVHVSETIAADDEQMLRRLLENHVAYTSSDRASDILDNWETAHGAFVKVMPEAYEQVIAERPTADARQMLPERASPLTESAVDSPK